MKMWIIINGQTHDIHIIIWKILLLNSGISKFPHSANVSPKLSHKLTTFQMCQENFHILSYLHLPPYLKVTLCCWRCEKFSLFDGSSDPSTANNRLLEISNLFALIFISNKSLANVIFYWLHTKLSPSLS